ncbi:MAG: hypothetical protein L6R41_008293 [Letrouitia leprolyta]|nr:MAG: hypothetical protein L6R41_008293 [Letrouitia leprolyta]
MPSSTDSLRDKKRGQGKPYTSRLSRRTHLLHQVAITYTSTSSEESLNQVIRSIEKLDNGSQIIKIKADLSSLSSPAEIVKQTLAAFGPVVHILVNNAGIGFPKPFDKITPEDFSSMFDVNFRAVLFMTQAVVPHLGPRGRIINIGSIGARTGFEQQVLYCSAKAALEGMSRALAVELGAEGHTVNTVDPGSVSTDILSSMPPEMLEMEKKNIPLENRLGTTDDIAQVVAFLAEENSRWITGQAISVSGGRAMY